MADPAPTVVVGVDGSKTATDAARWAVDEAVIRDIPLRLVYVISPPDSRPAWAHDRRLAAARAVLHDARRAVEATGRQVKIEAEILWGRTLDKLMEESRSAAMICVGSIGLDHAARGAGSLSASLAASARCPVAVICRPAGRPVTAELDRVIVQADNVVALSHAFEEATLRQAPLLAIAAAAGEDDADTNGSAGAQLRRRIARWGHLYPNVRVECAVVRGTVEEYLAVDGERDQLIVTDARACYDLCGAHNPGTSVLATRSSNL